MRTARIRIDAFIGTQFGMQAVVKHAVLFWGSQYALDAIRAIPGA